MMRSFRKILGMLALSAFISFAFGGGAQAQQHKWKAQILYGPNTVVYK